MVSQKFVPLLYKSVFQIGRLDLVSKSLKQYLSFNLINQFHTCCAIFWLEYSICVLPRQRCAYANIFSNHIFFVFYTPNCSNSFLLFLWISRKINPLNAKTFSCFKGRACIFRFTGLSVVETAKKLEKSECCVVKWSWRNDGFEGKKWRGRPKLLNEAAKYFKRRLDTKKETRRQSSHIRLASQVQKGSRKAV